MMRTPIFTTATALCLSAFSAQIAQAQSDGSCSTVSHRVVFGETVFTVSEKYYGSADEWSLIFYANQSKVSNPTDVAVGTVLTVPCPPGGGGFVEGAIAPDTPPRQREEMATPLRVDSAQMKLLTGDKNPPFTDRDWPGQGMLTELVNAAMHATFNPVTYSITWEDDWSKHLDPMLSSQEVDMGFPWAKPDCSTEVGASLCARFHYSEPVLEVLDLFFVMNGAQFSVLDEAAVSGKRMCRPEGLFTHEFDREDRQWLSRGLVTLSFAPDAETCFARLAAGDVDVVALDEFTGWATVSRMGLRGEIVPLPDPLGVQGLHMVISKINPRGTTHLYRFNAGLQALKGGQNYDEIVSRHLGVFWDRLN